MAVSRQYKVYSGAVSFACAEGLGANTAGLVESSILMECWLDGSYLAEIRGGEDGGQWPAAAGPCGRISYCCGHWEVVWFMRLRKVDEETVDGLIKNRHKSRHTVTQWPKTAAETTEGDEVFFGTRCNFRSPRVINDQGSETTVPVPRFLVRWGGHRRKREPFANQPTCTSQRPCDGRGFGYSN